MVGFLSRCLDRKGENAVLIGLARNDTAPVQSRAVFGGQLARKRYGSLVHINQCAKDGRAVFAADAEFDLTANMRSVDVIESEFFCRTRRRPLQILRLTGRTITTTQILIRPAPTGAIALTQRLSPPSPSSRRSRGSNERLAGCPNHRPYRRRRTQNTHSNSRSPASEL